MKKRQREHNSLGDIIKEIVTSNKLDKGLNAVSVEEAWHELMGPAISKYTDKVILEGTTLRIRLSSSVLREELSYGKPKIIAMINEALSKELIQKLELY